MKKSDTVNDWSTDNYMSRMFMIFQNVFQISELIEF